MQAKDNFQSCHTAPPPDRSTVQLYIRAISKQQGAHRSRKGDREVVEVWRIQQNPGTFEQSLAAHGPQECNPDPASQPMPNMCSVNELEAAPVVRASWCHGFRGPLIWCWALQLSCCHSKASSPSLTWSAVSQCWVPIWMRLLHQKFHMFQLRK